MLFNKRNKNKVALLLIAGTLTACNPQKTSSDGESSESPSDTVTQAHHDEGPTASADRSVAAPDVIELTSDQLRIGAVSLGKIDYRNLGQRLLVNGRLAVPAQSQITISALLGGFIRSIPLLPGQRVLKGQVLARIEYPELIQLQQDYAENHSRLTYLEAEFARQKELSEQNVSALKVFQQTKSDLGATQARLRGLAQRIRLVGLSPQAALDGKFSALYAVVAPVTGVITRIMATAGQFVQPSYIIAGLTSSQGLYAELTVFEKDLPQLREGQRVTIRLTNENGRERAGHIKLINRSIEADRSVRVVAQLDQADARLAPNTFLKATLDLGSSRVTALPEGAIVSAEGKDYIFIQTDEKALGKHEPGRRTNPEEEAEHAKQEEQDHHPGETEPPGRAGPTVQFKQIPVRRGVTEDGYSQVILPANLDLTKTQVVIKGAYAILSQLQAASGEEEHAH
ncbi:efflux RND transporter periplasmic adaptor subunit [Spirosoma flavum]|uniref:Efflux RND transporter periplasmic adaptor subunit n=1 Tax=Spirosoma flavum TaxID=2048557 RepID=A0ABW6AIM9_9BACT